MKMIGLARLGRDAELRTTPSGETVCNLSLAFNYGRKGDDGNRPTQWVDGSLWGKPAQALEQYLTKGRLVCVTLDEPHVETFQDRNGGTGHKLAARVSSIELAGGGEQRQDGAARAPAPAPAPRPAAPAPMPMDDDIPF